MKQLEVLKQSRLQVSRGLQFRRPNVSSEDKQSEVQLRFEIQQRQAMVLSQAATTLISAFARKIRLVQRYMTPAAGRRLLNMYATVGFLVRGEAAPLHKGVGLVVKSLSASIECVPAHLLPTRPHCASEAEYQFGGVGTVAVCVALTLALCPRFVDPLSASLSFRLSW